MRGRMWKTLLGAKLHNAAPRSPAASLLQAAVLVRGRDRNDGVTTCHGATTVRVTLLAVFRLRRARTADQRWHWRRVASRLVDSAAAWTTTGVASGFACNSRTRALAQGGAGCGCGLAAALCGAGARTWCW